MKIGDRMPIRPETELLLQGRLPKLAPQQVDNRTGETVKHLPSATQVDHRIRIRRLMGLHVDKKA
jgi:hypothetical protein